MEQNHDFQSLGKALAQGSFPQPPSSKPASASLLVEYNCKLCHDRGWLASDAPLAGANIAARAGLVRCECMKALDAQELRDRFLRLCRLPRGSEARTFETFKMRPGLEEAYRAALDVAEGKLKWLTLMAKVDRGKSHLAVAIAWRWLERDRPARYVAVPELLDELRRGYHPGADMSYDEEFFFLKNVDLLVLDDLGMESSTPWVEEKLDMLINYRVENALPLVVTTNLSFDQISERIASRLRREKFARVVVIDAPEYMLYREQKGAKAKK